MIVARTAEPHVTFVAGPQRIRGVLEKHGVVATDSLVGELHRLMEVTRGISDAAHAVSVNELCEIYERVLKRDVA